MHKHNTAIMTPPLTEIIVPMLDREASVHRRRQLTQTVSLDTDFGDRDTAETAWRQVSVERDDDDSDGLDLSSLPVSQLDDDDDDDLDSLTMVSTHSASRPSHRHERHRHRDSIPRCPQRNKQARFDCPNSPDASPQLPQRSGTTDGSAAVPPSRRTKARFSWSGLEQPPIRLPPPPPAGPGHIRPSSSLHTMSSHSSKDLPPSIPQRKWNSRGYNNSNSSSNSSNHRAANARSPPSAAFNAPPRSGSLSLADVFATIAASHGESDSAAPSLRQHRKISPASSPRAVPTLETAAAAAVASSPTGRRPYMLPASVHSAGVANCGTGSTTNLGTPNVDPLAVLEDVLSILHQGNSNNVSSLTTITVDNYSTDR